MHSRYASLNRNERHSDYKSLIAITLKHLLFTTTDKTSSIQMNVVTTSRGFPSNRATRFNHSVTLCGFWRSRTLQQTKPQKDFIISIQFEKNLHKKQTAFQSYFNPFKLQPNITGNQMHRHQQIAKQIIKSSSE